jgi:cobalt/nickel transport system permease protein
MVAFAFLILASVSTPPTAYPAFAGYLLFLGVVALLSRLPLKIILLRSSVALPFVAMAAIFIPFLKPDEVGGGYSLGIGGMVVSRSGLLVFWNVMVKSMTAVLAVVLLSATTEVSKILQGLEQLKVPKVLVMLAAFTYRYLWVVGGEVLRMKRARDSRCYGGRWLWHSKVIGQMIATLFLRSYERGERVYVAMVSRGFEGQPAGFGKSTFHTRDFLFVSTAVVWMTLLRLAVA